MASVQPRMNRLFAEDGKCFDVAIDHGFFNERSFLNGIEDLGKAVKTVVDADPDAIQLGPGQARLLQEIPGKKKPSLVFRTDVANIYGKKLPSRLFSRSMEASVELALGVDASCVVVNLLMLPDEPDLHYECVENIINLKAECVRYGMPLMIEPLVMQANSEAGGYMVDGDIDKIMPLVRQAVELGADIIKADPCDNPAEYHRVVEVACGIPVLVRGGGRVADRVILERTKELMNQGAKGIVYGRNVIQHDKPREMTQALMAVVHKDASVDDALKIIEG